MTYDGRYQDLIEFILDVNVRPTSNGNAYFKCPFHVDGKPSFGIDVDTGLWLCRSGCGEGNLTQLIMRVKSIDYMQAVALLRDWADGSPPDVELARMLAALTPSTEVIERQTHTLTGNLTRLSWPSWWPERGFDAASWMAFGVMLDIDNGDAVLPVLDADGVCAGEVRRRQPGATPKYIYNDGFNFSKHLFGAGQLVRRGDPRRATVVLVEGSLDCIWLTQHGYSALAILGSHLSDAQARVLAGMGVSRVLLAFDNDAAGRSATRKALDTLSGIARVDVTLWKGRTVKDVQDLRDSTELSNFMHNTASAIEYVLAATS